MMASKLGKILTKPFKKATSEPKLYTEKEEFEKELKSSATAVNSANKESVPGVHQTNYNYSSEWTRCSCCLKPLHVKYNSQCMPSSPKMRSCDGCQGCLCKDCRLKNGICHECKLRKEIKIDPEELMKLEDSKLREYIISLHYPPGGFQDCLKPFLVKQILVRFKVYDDWDPKKQIGQLQELVPTTVPRVASSNKNNEVSLRRKIAVPLPRVPSEEIPYPLLTAVDASHKLEAKPQLLEEMYSEVNRKSNDADSASGNSYHSFDEITDYQPTEKVQSPKKKESLKEFELIELKDIKSLDEIMRLRKRQMKHILKQAEIETNQMKGRNQYQQALIQLWEYHNSLNDDIEQPIRVHKQLHRLTYKVPAGLSTENEDILANCTVPVPIPVKQRSKAPMLKDLKATSFVELLNNEQLSEILHYHNFNPEEYEERQDKMFAVLCLWHAVKRGNNRASTNNAGREVKKRPEALELHNNGINPEVKLESLASPIDIKKLNPFQLQTLLKKYNVDPSQFETDSELYIAVVNLWTGTNNSPPPPPIKEPMKSEHIPVPYIDRGHPTEESTAKTVSKWLNHDKDSKEAPLALTEDITFIDDACSDFDAINIDESDSSSNSTIAANQF